MINTPIREVLTRTQERIDIIPDESYKQVTARLWGKGVVLRGEVQGSQIAAKKQYVVRSGQFLLSRIDARNGAFGLVPYMLDGAVVSNDFPSFDINESKLLPKYLEWMSKTPWFVDLSISASEGTTNRVRLQEKRFLELEIPLPPLAEQQRIVARIEALAGKVAEARRLRERATAETEALLASITEKVFTPKAHWKQAKIKDICYKPQYGFTASATFEPVGPKMLRITDIQDGRVNWETAPFCDCPDPEKYLLSKDDILFARTGATTGKSFLIQDECPEAVFASYLIRLRVKNTVSPQYLYNYFQSPGYWQQVTDKKTGTGQPNVNGSKLANLVVPVASPEEQKQMVNYLDDIRSQIWQMAQLQVNTQVELDALLPAILDKAFKGEL